MFKLLLPCPIRNILDQNALSNQDEVRLADDVLPVSDEDPRRPLQDAGVAHDLLKNVIAGTRMQVAKMEF